MCKNDLFLTFAKHFESYEMNIIFANLFILKESLTQKFMDIRSWIFITGDNNTGEHLLPVTDRAEFEMWPQYFFGVFWIVVWFVVDKTRLNAEERWWCFFTGLKSVEEMNAFPPHTVQRVDGKLRQPARMTQYSSIRGTEHFFYMLIELIRRFVMMKMDYFEAQWNFPIVFVLMHRSFPTIFLHLSDAWIKNQIKHHHRGSNLCPSWFQSATIPLPNSYMVFMLVC